MWRRIILQRILLLLGATLLLLLGLFLQRLLVVFLPRLPRGLQLGDALRPRLHLLIIFLPRLGLPGQPLRLGALSDEGGSMRIQYTYSQM